MDFSPNKISSAIRDTEGAPVYPIIGYNGEQVGKKTNLMGGLLAGFSMIFHVDMDAFYAIKKKTMNDERGGRLRLRIR